jgi:hypothetical protein
LVFLNPIKVDVKFKLGFLNFKNFVVGSLGAVRQMQAVVPSLLYWTQAAAN